MADLRHASDHELLEELNERGVVLFFGGIGWTSVSLYILFLLSGVLSGAVTMLIVCKITGG